MTSIVNRFRHSHLKIIIIAVWVISLGGAALAGALAFRSRAAIRNLIGTAINGQAIESSLYNIAVKSLPIPGEGRDGGVDALDDGLVLANRLGATWFVTSARELQPLSLKIPVNFDEFNNDPFNKKTNLRDQFGVKDILVENLGTRVRFLASFNFWYSEKHCYVLRVAGLEGTSSEIRNGAHLSWRTLFETSPCLPLEGVNNLNPTKDAGGRIVAVSDSEILISVGRFGTKGGEDKATDYSLGPQTRDNSYGKTILVDINSGTSRIYTIGHRNPEGLAVSPDGSIFSTEHGPKGGDELNRIVDGNNYGWPIASYGTQYDLLTFGDIPRKTHHVGFAQPIFAWVPSIGTSQLIVLKGTAFRQWAGDVIVSSLREQTLYRIRFAEGHAVVIEPIFIGHAIRDLVELTNGTVVLKTDDNFLVFLEPLDAARLTTLAPEERGKVVAGECAGCHAFTPEAPDGMGPSLWGIVGRGVASRKSFAYSSALGALGGKWTEDRLRSFISDPEMMAPGTKMEITGKYDGEALDDLIAFLKRLN